MALIKVILKILWIEVIHVLCKSACQETLSALEIMVLLRHCVCCAVV